MGFFAIDDDFYDAPEVLAAGNAAIGLWVRVGCWAVRHKTRGYVPTVLVLALDGAEEADALVAAGLWEPAGDEGYWFTPVGTRQIHAQENRRRKKFSKTVARMVFERDGFACVHCGTTESLTIDHVIPWSLGGSDDLDNLQTLCRPCNSRKGARL